MLKSWNTSDLADEAHVWSDCVMMNNKDSEKSQQPQQISIILSEIYENMFVANMCWLTWRSILKINSLPFCLFKWNDKSPFLFKCVRDFVALEIVRVQKIRKKN